MSVVRLKKFSYQGYDENDSCVQGELQAANSRLATVKLKSQGIAVKSLRRVYFQWKNLWHRQRIKPADVLTFLQQLQILLQAGLPLLQAIQIIRDQSKKEALSVLLENIAAGVLVGKTLSSLLMSFRKHFDRLTCELIAIGEQSGQLETLLNQIVLYQHKIIGLKQKIKKALWYPATVLIVAIIVVMVLLIFVIPQFAEMFASFHAILPLPTRVVMGIAHFFGQIGWLILLLAILIGMVFIYAKNHGEAFALIWDQTALKIPVFGQLLQKFILVRVMRTLAITSAAGIPLLSALKMASVVAHHRVFTRSILLVRDRVNQGERLSDGLASTKMFPDQVIHLVAIGEMTGQLDDMLQLIANFYEFEIDSFMNCLSQWLEPIMMVVLSVIIGSLMVAMYLPIFKLGMVI